MNTISTSSQEERAADAPTPLETELGNAPGVGLTLDSVVTRSKPIKKCT